MATRCWSNGHVVLLQWPPAAAVMATRCWSNGRLSYVNVSLLLQQRTSAAPQQLPSCNNCGNH
jgi:hypothetical protein